MARKALLMFLVLVIPALACAHVAPGNVVDVRVVSDEGLSLQGIRLIRV